MCVRMGKGHRTMDSEFEKIFFALCNSRNPRSVWNDFVVLSAIGISNGLQYRQERGLFSEVILSHYGKHEKQLMQGLFERTKEAFIENPNQDYLGTLFLNFHLATDSSEYHIRTYQEAERMAKLCIEEMESEPYTFLADPRCSTGAMLIASFNQIAKMGRNSRTQLFCVGYEGNLTLAMMCYIQMSVLGITGYVANNRKKKASNGSALIAPENAWCTPAYFHRTWQARRLAQYVMDL